MGQVTNWSDKCLTPLKDKITIVASVTKVFIFLIYLVFTFIYFFLGVVCIYEGDVWRSEETFGTGSLLQPRGFWRLSSLLEIHAFTL